jgi:polysaccharide pyruvyl transferase WcaK-like protein
VNHKKYYVLSGGYDTKNVGDYAMLKYFVNKSHNKNIGVKLLSRHNHQHLINYYCVDELLENFEYPCKKESVGNFFRGLNFGENSSHLVNLVDELRRSEGLVIGGGRLLVDYFVDVMKGPLCYWTTLVTLCKFLDIPVHIYAMTFIPLKTKDGEKSVKFIVDNCESISVRDKDSLQYLRDIGCTNNKIAIIPDPAYALSWQPSTLNNGKVAITARHISDAYCGMNLRRYIEQMEWVINKVESLGYKTYGVPHCYYDIDDPNTDDRNILKILAKNTSLQVVEEEMLDIAEYAKFYQNMDALIGVRRHSMLFAAAAGVPVLGICETENGTRACAEIDAEPPLLLNFDRDKAAYSIENILNQRHGIAKRQSLAFNARSNEVTTGFDQSPIWKTK